jgi:hypothetical protein
MAILIRLGRFDDPPQLVPPFVQVKGALVSLQPVEQAD